MANFKKPYEESQLQMLLTSLFSGHFDNCCFGIVLSFSLDVLFLAVIHVFWKLPEGFWKGSVSNFLKLAFQKHPEGNLRKFV